MKRSGFTSPGKPLARGTSTLTRSPMARGTSQLVTTTPMPRSTKPMAAVGQRAKRMRQGKVAANVTEQLWMDQAQAFGCIVCHLHHGLRTPAEIHHLKEGDRRMGHLYSIGLCTAHHRGGADTGPFISRHPWRTRFETAYGLESELLFQLRTMLNWTMPD